MIPRTRAFSPRLLPAPYLGVVHHEIVYAVHFELQEDAEGHREDAAALEEEEASDRQPFVAVKRDFHRREVEEDGEDDKQHYPGSDGQLDEGDEDVAHALLEVPATSERGVRESQRRSCTEVYSPLPVQLEVLGEVVGGDEVGAELLLDERSESVLATRKRQRRAKPVAVVRHIYYARCQFELRGRVYGISMLLIPRSALACRRCRSYLLCARSSQLVASLLARSHLVEADLLQELVVAAGLPGRGEVHPEVDAESGLIHILIVHVDLQLLLHRLEGVPHLEVVVELKSTASVLAAAHCITQLYGRHLTSIFSVLVHRRLILKLMKAMNTMWMAYSTAATKRAMCAWANCGGGLDPTNEAKR